MNYGPNTADVQAFINSLPGLTPEKLNASIKAMLRSVLDLYEGLDGAQYEIMAAEFDSDLSEEVKAARVATRNVVRSLRWAKVDEQTLAESANLAVGAIVVLNRAPFEKLLPAFVPFRHTTVAVPVAWGD